MAKRLFKELERAYGFDEVAIVPGQVTINPDMTSTKMTLGHHSFDIPHNTHNAIIMQSRKSV